MYDTPVSLPLLKTRDVAKMLQVHEMTVYRLCKLKKLPHVRVGGNFRFKAEWIDRLFEDSVKELK